MPVRYLRRLGRRGPAAGVDTSPPARNRLPLRIRLRLRRPLNLVEGLST